MSDDLIIAYEKRYQADSRDPSQAERLGVWTAAWNAATQGTRLALGSFRAWPAGISAAPGIDLADPWRGLYDPARMPKLDGVNDYHVAHPDLPKWPEDDERGISPLVKAQGFELEVVLGDYTEEGADDPDHDFCAWLAQWKPAPPAGDHWRLVCIQDTEDGPAALYVRPLALIDASPKSARHPDDAAVDAFAAALKAKLADARAKGRGGWRGDEPGMQQRLSDMLRAHVEKGDPRDVANFCMFLHQRGEGISVPAPMPRPMETAPRDGTLVRLLVDFDDNATDDGPGPHWTIGANTVEHDGEDEWKFAGWDWNFDEFTAGDGKPVGWLPLIDAGLQSNEVQDSRFPNGLADAVKYANDMESAAAALYEHVFGHETDGSDTGTDLLGKVLQQLQDSTNGGSEARDAELKAAHDSGHDTGIRWVLGYLNGAGECGGTYYEEILAGCDRERIIQSAIENGELEFTGLADYIKEEGTPAEKRKVRAALRAQAQAGDAEVQP
ncbi:MAG: hypothetical protein AB7D31_15335 [Stenotrophomonas sp.]